MELILKISFYDSMWNSVHQGTEPKYDPKGIILILFIKGHQMMLHAKYECSSLYGLSQVDF